MGFTGGFRAFLHFLLVAGGDDVEGDGVCGAIGEVRVALLLSFLRRFVDLGEEVVKGVGASRASVGDSGTALGMRRSASSSSLLSDIGTSLSEAVDPRFSYITK